MHTAFNNKSSQPQNYKTKTIKYKISRYIQKHAYSRLPFTFHKTEQN